MVAVFGTLAFRGGRVPKLSFFGETSGFLILTDGLSPRVCADAAVKSANAEIKSNSKPHAAAIARVNHLKCIVNNSSPFEPICLPEIQDLRKLRSVRHVAGTVPR